MRVYAHKTNLLYNDKESQVCEDQICLLMVENPAHIFTFIDDAKTNKLGKQKKNHSSRINKSLLLFLLTHIGPAKVPGNGRPLLRANNPAVGYAE